MMDSAENLALFIQQQIELYGDDLCLSELPSIKIGPTPHVATSASATNVAQPPVEAPTVDWQQATSLDELDAAINTCQKCALGISRNNFVFGSGNVNADVMFIGTAPGVDEDRIGDPFVGDAGDLLTKILAAINFKPEDVYTCNILKCHPPKNRIPLPEESAFCKPYLLKQIELIQPKILCCLGHTAAKILLETQDTVEQLRGQWFSFHGAQLMVTFHPSELLQKPEFKRDTWEDVQRLQKLYLENKVS